MTRAFTVGAWSGGYAEWTEGDTAFLSVAFTWNVPTAFSRACWFNAAGYRVRAGGPGLWHPKSKARMGNIAELGGEVPEALFRHNPMATRASRGCDEGCAWCIVPRMDGRELVPMPDFTPRPVLVDDNLSALSMEYQRYIVDRYLGHGVPLLDANSGFGPSRFDGETFDLWSRINDGPWRFGADETGEMDEVARVIGLLRRRGVPPKKIRPYVMIGREPFDLCMERIQRVLDAGAEPYVQPEIKLVAEFKEPWVRHDWTAHRLKQVQRWVNRFLWKTVPFAEYDASAKTRRVDRYDAQTGLFV